MMDLPPKSPARPRGMAPPWPSEPTGSKPCTPRKSRKSRRRCAPSTRPASSQSRRGAQDFPLPTLARRLARILADVLDGRGFVLLRGLPVQKWGSRQSACALLGLGMHLGNLRSQNAQGHLLGHVRDQGLSSQDPNVRIYQTRERQNYHTDSCDVVGLLCLHPARAGGLSSLVSTVTIFNELRRRRPDLAQVLFEPIETDRRGEVPPGQKPFFRVPVFNWHAGLLTTIYHRPYIESARRFPEVPPLTALQVEALDGFDELANDPALHFFMEFRAGDVQLVHNHTLLHDRTAFEDWPEPERRPPFAAVVAGPYFRLGPCRPFSRNAMAACCRASAAASTSRALP